MVDPRRTTAYCGFLAPTIGIASVLLATLLAPPETFTWSERALSDLGRLGAETFWLFNGGLLVAALLALPFTWRLVVDARNTLERVGGLCFGLSAVGMGLVGVFFLDHTAVYLDTDLHAPAALLLFGMAPVTTALYGAGSYLAGDHRWGGFSVVLGLLHVLTWAVWIGYVTRVATAPTSWFALQEMIVVALFALWTVLAARRSLGTYSSPRTTA
ncbi:DUF998 domain-containing protein [Natronorarus salvus]|uniref:DUF998 domain-containing protein n=1 Tax=Natronorarus salvus TaxID=3117733 RepID=UPI002F2692FB